MMHAERRLGLWRLGFLLCCEGCHGGERRVYSSKSDVWAFGVLLWEIITLGFLPSNAVRDVSVMYP